MAAKSKKQDINIRTIGNKVIQSAYELVIIKERLKELNEEKDVFHDYLTAQLGDKINVTQYTRNDLGNGVTVCIAPPSKQLRFNNNNCVAYLKEAGLFEEAAAKGIVFNEHDISFKVYLANKDTSKSDSRLNNMMDTISKLSFEEACGKYITLSDEIKYKESKLKEIEDKFRKDYIDVYVEENGEESLKNTQLVDEIGKIIFSVSDKIKVDKEKLSEIEANLDFSSFMSPVVYASPTVTIMTTENYIKLQEKIYGDESKKNNVPKPDLKAQEEELLRCMEIG